MKALILRDLRAYKVVYILLMIVMILYSYLNIRFGSVDGIIGFQLIMMPSFAGMILFIADDELIPPLFASLPVTRKHLVLSKYLSTYIIAIILIGFTYLIIWYLGMDYPDAQKDLGRLLSTQGLLFSFIPITLIVSVCYPFLFRYGLKIAVRILMASFAVLYGIGMMVLERMVQANLLVPRRGVFIAAMTLFNHLEYTMTPLLLYSMSITALILLLAVSVCLSLKWFGVKDI